MFRVLGNEQNLGNNMINKGSLIFFCHKPGVKPSGFPKKIASDKRAVLLSEVDWLSALYPQQMSSFEDYQNCVSRLKPLIKSYVQNILSIGTHVVMDFPANTRQQRRWFLDIATEIGATHELFLIHADGLGDPNVKGENRLKLPFNDERLLYFEMPDADEGLVITEIV